MLSAVLLFASCQRDADVVEMNNGSLQLRFQMLGNASVEVSRATEAAESDVENVMVYFFNENGSKAIDPIYLNKGALTLTESGDYTRTYTADVATNTGLADGKYYVFAIANIETDMWKLSEANLDYSTYDNFVKALISASWLEPLGAHITMTGHCGSDGSVTVSGGKLASTIYLKRPYAKATFNFKTGSELIEFTPESYSIYNLPGKASIFERNAENAVASNFWKSEGMAFSTQSPNSFTFYQLENQKSGSDIERYHDRAVNAPENSTYVVVKGAYKEYKLDADNKKSLKYTGDVSYKIHLGDFSAANGNDYNDFNVLRNTAYTYDVTINGVEKIIVEAKKEVADYENGAEGYIIDASQSKMIYTLDAHYETVQLRIPVDGLFDSGNASKSLNISVSTPMMPEANRNQMIDWSIINGPMTDEAFYAAYDLQWVEFVPTTDATFATYPGSAGVEGQGKGIAFYIRDFVKELKKAIDEIDSDVKTSKVTITKDNGENVVFATCFVNEYYYDNEPWPLFVGKENRTLNFIQAPAVSDDKNSIYAQTLFSFSQKSIETPFKYDASINGFGMETYNESGALALHKNYKWSGYDDHEYSNPDNGTVASNNELYAYRDMTNGRDNMIGHVKIGSTVTRWDQIMTEGGYSYEGQEEMTYTKMIGDYNYAYAACMQRNRDIDGEGDIDGDEVRWYLAAVNQYRMMWLGEKGYPASSALYTGDLSAIPGNDKNNNGYDWQPHYFTNSDPENRIFWAVEGAATGRYNTSYMYEGQHVRCVRNLSKVESETSEMTPDGEWYWDSANAGALYIASNLSNKSVRDLGKVGEYAAHNERDVHNTLPKAFVMAKNNLERELNRTENTVTTYTQVGAPQIASAEYGEQEVGGNVSVTLSKPSYSSSKFTVNLSQALPSGVKLHYATSSNGSKTEMTVSGTTATSGTVNPSSGSWGSQTATIYVWLYNGSTYSTSSAKIDYSYNSWYGGASTSISSGATLSIEAETETISAYTVTLSSVASGKSYYWSSTAGANGKQVTPNNKVLTIETTASPIYIWCTASMNGETTKSESSSVTSAGVITNSSVVDDVTGEKTTTTYTVGGYITLADSKNGSGVASEDNYCAQHYYENDDYSDLGKWRIPNQRELVPISMYSNLSPEDKSPAFISRSKSSVSSIYANRGMHKYSYTAIRLNAKGTITIRCVRDATADEVAAKMPEDKEYDGEFEDNGDAI